VIVLPWLIIAIPFLILAWLHVWSHAVIDAKPKTVPEAAARALLYLARWLTALADGLQAGAIAYREHTKANPIESRLEAHRLANEAARPKPAPRQAKKQDPPAKSWIRRFLGGEYAGL